MARQYLADCPPPIPCRFASTTLVDYLRASGGSSLDEEIIETIEHLQADNERLRVEVELLSVMLSKRFTAAETEMLLSGVGVPATGRRVDGLTTMGSEAVTARGCPLGRRAGVTAVPRARATFNRRLR